MTTKNVYDLLCNPDDLAPKIDSEFAQNSQMLVELFVRWKTLKMPYVLETDVSLKIPDADAGEWDYYGYGGTPGMFSRRMLDVMSPLLVGSFGQIRFHINKREYCVLKPIEYMDYLDENKSNMKYRSDGSFLSVDRPSFKKEIIIDPSIFCVDRIKTNLFVTDSVPKLLKSKKLRGYALFFAEVPLIDKTQAD